MNTPVFLKPRHFLNLAFLFLAMSFLPNCTSTHNNSISFGKRKYTKGHFSNPVAKLKMNYKNDKQKNIVLAEAKGEKPKKEIEKKQEVPSLSSRSSFKSTNETGDKKAIFNSSSIDTKIYDTAFVSPSSSYSPQEGNTILNDTFLGDSAGSGYSDSSSTKSGVLLLLAITCLLLALLMYCLVLVADIAGGTGLGCLLVGATVILGVLGLILLIMWLVSLKK